MRGRILAILTPVLLGILLLGSGYFAQRLGWIEEGTWAYLWPSMVALVFLVGGVMAFLTGGLRWLLPLVTGLLTQCLGILLYWLIALDSPWEILFWTAVSVGTVLAGMGVYSLIKFLRARRLEKKGLLNPDELEGGVDPEELARIRDNLLEAVQLMRRAGRGRNAIYELPWYLVMGRPSAGKTFAIKESGLGLPVKKDWVKGIGGTYSCDFFFTNELIFMDTPGGWVRNGADETARRYWDSLLRLLRKYRGKRPLDGVVVVISAEDLLGIKVDPEVQADVQDQAANIREILDLVHEKLGFRFPVYVVVTKGDLIGGFTDFFWGVPAQRRHEIFGWSNPNPNDPDAEGIVRSGLDAVTSRLDRYRLEMLARLGSKSRNRRLFFFTEELRQIRRPLTEFVDMLFAEDPSRQTPIFRGCYFTSAVQEGSPVSRAMSSLARDLNIPPTKVAAERDDGGKRAFFLLELFRELMVGDQGLLGRTAKHWLKRRRSTAFGAFLPAGLAALFLLLAGTSLVLNWSLYNRIEDDVPRLVEELAAERKLEFDYASLDRRLELTGELARYHRKLTNFNPFRRLGMRHASLLAGDVYDVYREQFSDSVLRPMLQRAMAVGSNGSCADRVEVFHSVVWMRGGKRFDTSRNNLAGFDILWGDWKLEGRQIAELRARIHRQFNHLVLHEESVGSLLAGFDMVAVANGIVSRCDLQGAGSAIDLFRTFQTSCQQGYLSDPQLVACYDLLESVVNWHDDDYDRYLDNIEALKGTLERLRSVEGEADRAYAALEPLNLERAESSACLSKFVDMLPQLQKFAVREDLLVSCQQQVAGLSASQAVQKRGEVTAQQQADQELSGEALRGSMATYGAAECHGFLVSQGIDKLDFLLVKDVSENYRRQFCLNKPPGASLTPRSRSASTPRAPRPKTGGSTRASTTPPRSGQPRGEKRGPFVNFCTTAGRKYDPRAVRQHEGAWLAKYAASNDPEVSQARRDREQDDLAREVRRYGSKYSEAWFACLGQVNVEAPQESVPAWLQVLADSPEWAALFEQPVAEAQLIEAAAQEPPLQPIVGSLKPLIELADFKAAKLPEYQSQLRQVAQELINIEQDPGRFPAFRDAYQRRDPANALIRLDEWVKTKVAPIDQGLARLFRAPLLHAQNFVESDSPLVAQWAKLYEIYDRDIAGRFPFDASGTELPDAKAITGLFGRQGGLVHKIETEGQEIGARSRQWLQSARRYSEAFFAADSDELRQLRIFVQLDQITPDQQNLDKKYTIGRSTLWLGPGSDYSWDLDADNREKPVRVQLFGEDASGAARVEAWVFQKKNPVFKKRKIEETAKVVASEVDGAPWAPVQLLRDGLAQSGSSTMLSYDVPWKWDKDKKQGTFKMTYRLNSSQLPLILELMNNGLAAPPEDIHK